MYGMRLNMLYVRLKKKTTLVSGDAGDEKDLHPGGRKFIFFTQLHLIF